MQAIVNEIRIPKHGFEYDVSTDSAALAWTKYRHFGIQKRLKYGNERLKMQIWDTFLVMPIHLDYPTPTRFQLSECEPNGQLAG